MTNTKRDALIEIRALLVAAMERLDELERQAPREPTKGLVLTTPEAAERARVCAKTIRRWIEDGRLPARKVGRYYRIVTKDLDAYLSGERRPPHAETEDPELRAWAERMMKGRS